MAFISVSRMAFAVAVLALASGCGSNSSGGSTAAVYDVSSASVTSSATANAATSSDNATTVVSFNEKGWPAPAAAGYRLATALRALIPSAMATACSAGAPIAGATCSSNAMTLAFAGCSATNNGLGAVWNGTETLTFSAGACANASSNGLLGMGSGSSVTLTSSGGITRTTALGAKVSTDSNASGFSTILSGGLQITCNGPTGTGGGSCSTTGGRTVNMLGVHRAEYDAYSTLLYDHTISTPTPLTITGYGASKSIAAGGVIQLQHNLAKFIATSTITQALTFSAGCCVPTGGAVTTAFSTGKTGSETLTYGPSCGQASVNGNSVTLTHCM